MQNKIVKKTLQAAFKGMSLLQLNDPWCYCHRHETEPFNKLSMVWLYESEAPLRKTGDWSLHHWKTVTSIWVVALESSRIIPYVCEMFHQSWSVCVKFDEFWSVFNEWNMYLKRSHWSYVWTNDETRQSQKSTSQNLNMSQNLKINILYFEDKKQTLNSSKLTKMAVLW